MIKWRWEQDSTDTIAFFQGDKAVTIAIFGSIYLIVTTMHMVVTGG